jgi:hypothetical protein
MESIDDHRSRVLRTCATRVRPIPPLPVVDLSVHGKYPAWESYLRDIYGTLSNATYDLNTFTWFYWTAPLRLDAFHFTACGGDTPMEDGIPWIGDSGSAWNWGPEALVRRLGYFVQRSHAIQHFRNNAVVEVMRVDGNDFLDMSEKYRWFFFPVIGSGITVSIDETVIFKEMCSFRAIEMQVPRRPNLQFWEPDVWNLRRTEGGRCTLTADVTLALTCKEMDVSWRNASEFPDPGCRLRDGDNCRIGDNFAQHAMFGSAMTAAFFAIIPCLYWVIALGIRRARSYIVVEPIIKSATVMSVENI